MLRFKHGITHLNRYRLGYGAIRDSARSHAQWLLVNKKFEHSSQQTYGENLCQVKWNSSFNPSEEDKLAIGSFAVKQWYKEYVNYSQFDHDWNGNIFHDEQIGHFLQVLWNGKKGDNKIGVGIKSNERYTIIVVHYENKRLASEKIRENIKNARLISSNSFLTIQEEEDLRSFMKKRKKEYNQEYRKFNNGEENNATDIRIKLKRNCSFYLQCAEKKIGFLRKEAADPYKSSHNYDSNFICDWLCKVETLSGSVIDGFELLKKPLDHENICQLFEKVMEIVIPNSLANERFENLQLEAFFKGTLDILNFSATVGGSTPSNSRLPNHTLANCLTSTKVTPDTALAKNNTRMTTNQYNKVVKVFVGYFSVVLTGPDTSRYYTETQFENWKECCKRITARWDKNGAKNVIRGYNALRQNGSEMDESWPGTDACVPGLDYSSQTIKKIFS